MRHQAEVQERSPEALSDYPGNPVLHLSKDDPDQEDERRAKEIVTTYFPNIPIQYERGWTPYLAVDSSFYRGLFEIEAFIRQYKRNQEAITRRQKRA